MTLLVDSTVTNYIITNKHWHNKELLIFSKFVNNIIWHYKWKNICYRLKMKEHTAKTLSVFHYIQMNAFFYFAGQNLLNNMIFYPLLDKLQHFYVFVAIKTYLYIDSPVCWAPWQKISKLYISKAFKF